MSITVLPRDIALLILARLSIRSILALNVTSHDIHLWLLPCVCDMKLRHEVPCDLFTVKTVTKHIIPQLNKQVIYSFNVVFGSQTANVQRLTETPSGNIATYVFTSDRTTFRQVYIYTLYEQAVYIIAGNYTIQSIRVWSTDDYTSLFDIARMYLQYYDKFTVLSSSQILERPLNIDLDAIDAVKRIYTVWHGSDIQSMFKCMDFLQSMIHLSP